MTHFRLLSFARRDRRVAPLGHRPPARRHAPRDRDRERGVALLSALLITMLMAALLVGFTALISSDSRMRGLSDSRGQAFYAAHAGLEQLTADLGDLFAVNFAPTAAQVNALATTPPPLPDVQWLAPDGSSGYTITFVTDASGAPKADTRTIESGPWQGFIGLVTPYTLTATARAIQGSEVSLTRQLQTVSIPVFQFGMFSQSDLSFFAGPDFNFGGRVHTNGNLFLASKATLTMSDRVTAVGEVVRKRLSNGWDATSDYTGNVRIITSTGSYRNLAFTEGSVVTDVGSTLNEPTWTNLSEGTYNHYIMNGRTGARVLNLPIVSFGAQPVDLIKLPVPGEDISNPQIFEQRYFSQVSVRILLADTAAEITNLPGVTGGAPLPLGSAIPGYTVDNNHPPLAASANNTGSGDRIPLNAPRLSGFIKIEHQLPGGGGWQDVTLEILDLGIAGRNLAKSNCTEPNPNAVIRIERLQDNTSSCGDAGTTTATKYWPNVLYDAREGALRDSAGSSSPYFGGVMHYVELDVGNLNKWLTGAIGVNGPNTSAVTGYSVYFSDRRGDRVDPTVGRQTGEYGFEDFVNPASSSGSPNNSLDTGEDVNGDGVLATYGETPQLPAGATSPLVAATRPWTVVDSNVTTAGDIARRNPAIFFRRALKLTDGQAGHLPMPGLTVVAENPVYVEGNYNASNAGFSNPDAACAVIADAVTLLSQNWNDRTSFLYPHTATNRNATTTWYRLGIIAGKQLSFPRPSGEVEDFGTDGGAHNFLRYLEDWSGQTLYYRGAIATLATSRQAVGTYKCCTSVYSPPSRGYNFDVNFLTPLLLPPLTPMFRDVNTTGFTQVIRPH